MVLAMPRWRGNCHKPVENHKDNTENGQILLLVVRNASKIVLKTLRAFPSLPQHHWVNRFWPQDCEAGTSSSTFASYGWNSNNALASSRLICIYTSLGRMNPAHVLIISADMTIHFYPCQHHKSNTALQPQYPLPQAPSAQMCQQVSNLGAFIAGDGAGEAVQLDSLANVCSALWRLRSAV